jgi:hypothetical protein
MSTAGFIGRMTREQRDLLRKQIDVRMRERLERGRNAQAQARTRYEAGRVAPRPLIDAYRVPQS